MKRLKQILEIMCDIPFEERTDAIIQARHFINAEYDRLRKEEDYAKKYDRYSEEFLLPNSNMTNKGRTLSPYYELSGEEQISDWEEGVLYKYRRQPELGGNDHADET